jgi:hypothetical protein
LEKENTEEGRGKQKTKTTEKKMIEINSNISLMKIN